MISQEPLLYFIELTKYAEQIDHLQSNCYLDSFRETCDLSMWIIQTRPDLLAAVNILSQVTKDIFL